MNHLIKINASLTLYPYSECLIDVRRIISVEKVEVDNTAIIRMVDGLYYRTKDLSFEEVESLVNNKLYRIELFNLN